MLRILWSESAANHLFLTLPERESHHILWDGCDFFYIMYEGNFDVLRNGKRLASLRTGDFFGEISLLQNSISSADVKAREESKCLTVHKTDFLRFLGRDFFVGLQFEKISSKRLAHPIFPL